MAKRKSSRSKLNDRDIRVLAKIRPAISLPQLAREAGVSRRDAKQSIAAALRFFGGADLSQLHDQIRAKADRDLARLYRDNVLLVFDEQHLILR